jgi:hypothetical protein
MATTEYFSKFPTIDYNGQMMVNICVRGGISNGIVGQTSAFMPYNLQFDGESPETVSFDYYNDINAYWLVNMANEVSDPAFDWMMPDAVLQDVLSDMYGSVANAQNTNLFYQRQPASNSDPYNVTITLESNISQGNSAFLPVTAYNKALVDNEAKRQVYLVRSDMLTSIDSALGVTLQNAS